MKNSKGYVGFLDIQGKWVIEPNPNWNFTKGVHDGFALVWNYNHSVFVGMIDRNGKTIIPIEFVDIMPLQDEYFLTLVANKSGSYIKFGLYNKNGIEIVPAEYDSFYYKGNGQFLGIIGNNRYLITDTTYQ